MTNKNMDRIVFLDYMRTIAFISVLIGHKFIGHIIDALNDDSIHASTKMLLTALFHICYGGAAGVVIFFITSGYIILHVMQTETTKEFIIKRIFRVYPLFIFAVVLEAVLDRLIMDKPFADISTWIPRLLLLGDYFEVRPVLGSVEWTLRIEISFYILMALLKSLGLIRKQQILPLIFIAVTVFIHLLPPFSTAPGLAYGYFSAYSPFLFIGSCIYLIEKKLAPTNLCIFTITLIMVSFFNKIATYIQDWKDLNYGVYALAIFTVAWAMRYKIVDGPIVRILSSLTYSVYLFHNWLWTYIQMGASGIGVPSEYLKLVTVSSLFLFCYIINKTVEQKGLALGRFALRYTSRKNKVSVPA